VTSLRPMTQEAYPAFFEHAATGYAAQNVAGGRWRSEDAADLARAETTRLLPQGLETPDNYVFDVVDDLDDRAVGYLWFAAAPRGSIKIAFVCQVTIYPEFQGQGHAKAALALVEQRAKELGLAGMALHVFAYNKAARGLYESAGYEVSSLNMIKPFGRSDA
jgi:ribosomal protein S18 acetylase RimI-like enzyme